MPSLRASPPVIAAFEVNTTEDAVIRWVAERLAKYKAPGHVAFAAESLPRNHVGKVDKIALRARWNELYGVQ